MHGCSITALYGDDGEMQCSSCMIDFKRDSEELIEQKFNDIVQKRIDVIAKGE